MLVFYQFVVVIWGIFCQTWNRRLEMISSLLEAGIWRRTPHVILSHNLSDWDPNFEVASSISWFIWSHYECRNNSRNVKPCVILHIYCVIFYRALHDFVESLQYICVHLVLYLQQKLIMYVSLKKWLLIP